MSSSHFFKWFFVALEKRAAVPFLAFLFVFRDAEIAGEVRQNDYTGFWSNTPSCLFFFFG